MIVIEIGDIARMELSTNRPDDLKLDADAPAIDSAVPAKSRGQTTSFDQKRNEVPDFAAVREAALEDPELATLWLHLFDDSNP